MSGGDGGAATATDETRVAQCAFGVSACRDACVSASFTVV